MVTTLYRQPMVTVGISYKPSVAEYRIFWRTYGKDDESKAYYTDNPDDVVQTLEQVVDSSRKQGVNVKLSEDAFTRRMLEDYSPRGD